MKRLFVLGLLVATAGFARPSDACMREMAVHDNAPMNPAAEVAKSDTMLETGGNNSGVLATLSKPFPALRGATPSAKEPLQNHALRNAALAVGRSNGAITGLRFKADESAANMSWAVSTMRGLLALRPTDASLEADLAEVLARTSAGKEEGFKKLSTLAEKDLIGSPQALGQLSRLRKEKGDLPGAKEAFEKCRSMTTPEQSQVCGAAPVAVPSKPPVAPPVNAAAKPAARS